MYELKKTGKVLTSKSIGTGPSSYEKRIYRAAVSQRLRKTDPVYCWNSDVADEFVMSWTQVQGENRERRNGIYFVRNRIINCYFLQKQFESLSCRLNTVTFLVIFLRRFRINPE